MSPSRLVQAPESTEIESANLANIAVFAHSRALLAHDHIGLAHDAGIEHMITGTAESEEANLAYIAISAAPKPAQPNKSQRRTLGWNLRDTPTCRRATTHRRRGGRQGPCNDLVSATIGVAQPNSALDAFLVVVTLQLRKAGNDTERLVEATVNERWPADGPRWDRAQRPR